MRDRGTPFSRVMQEELRETRGFFPSCLKPRLGLRLLLPPPPATPCLPFPVSPSRKIARRATRHEQLRGRAEAERFTSQSVVYEWPRNGRPEDVAARARPASCAISWMLSRETRLLTSRAPRPRSVPLEIGRIKARGRREISSASSIWQSCALRRCSRNIARG